ncbi:MAG TPA: transketolase C-terminal domain-containing protein, partial [Acidimicrobiia bacterium]|nr:transketolase C-terminal domain-containing protein [Acidimicrobiia bacterium]
VIIGTAVGLAAEGFVPVPEIQFLGFSWQAFHQLAGQLARLRYRSDGRFDCPVTVRAPFGGGVRTPELHSEALEAQLVQCPGLKVVLPASAADAKGLLASAIRDPDPVMFLEPLKGYRLVKDDVPEGEHLVPLGKANVVRTGDDVVLIAWSAQVEVTRKAAAVLADEHGLSAGVLDLRTLVPLDIDAIVAAVEHTGRAVVVSEAPHSAGFAAEVVATICEEAFYSLEAPVARVGGYDVPYPVGMLEESYVPDAARVVAAALRVCGEGA